MFDLLYLITSAFFSLVILLEIISWIKLWEDKDFSLRRIALYIKETKSGRKLLFGPVALAKWLSILLYFSTVFWQGSDDYYHVLVLALYGFLFLGALKNILDRQFAFPKLNISNIFIFSFTVFSEIVFYAFAPLDRFLWLLLIEKMMPWILSFFLLFEGTFFDFSRDSIINRALKIIEKNKKLLSIAVVGSYGRGSTKEFITRILATKYNVLSTRSSFNNAAGIAKTIISELTDKKQIFVAELDDYTKTDIVQMCGLIAPKIVVMSGINQQKLSTFGTMDKIIESKREAVNSLSGDGVAIFNGDSDYSDLLFKKTRKKKFIYSTQNSTANISATNIREAKFSLSFDVEIFGKKYKFSDIKLLGRHNIENLLPAIFIGIYMGIDFSQIRAACRALRPLPRAMEPKIAKSGAVVIDDTHNANINSVLKVLSYMEIYKGKKVLVLEPLVELGNNAAQIHELLGQKIAQVCDFVFLTNANYFEAVIRGSKKSNSYCSFKVVNPARISRYIKKESSREDVVVFEGKETAPAMRGLDLETIYR